MIWFKLAPAGPAVDSHDVCALLIKDREEPLQISQSDQEKLKSAGGAQRGSVILFSLYTHTYTHTRFHP